MKSKKIWTTIWIILMIIPSLLSAQNEADHLKRNFDLAAVKTQEVQFYTLKSECITFALDGKRIDSDIYRLYLKYTPSKISGKNGEEYTCLKFTVQYKDSPELSIPALENWSYVLTEGMDDKNQVFGIDHGKFENLKDINGNPLQQGKSYHVYNAFIDFHGFCNVFPDPTPDGNGVQDLKYIGQKIVHAAANTEPPTNLGSNIAPGSFFKNGEITLEFKGISLVNKKECAMLGIDSGESTFKMIMKPMPDMEINTIGSSHYFGDIYKDLKSGWVQKVTFDEIVLSETTLPMPPNKINSVIERHITILNVTGIENN